MKYNNSSYLLVFALILTNLITIYFSYRYMQGHNEHNETSSESANNISEADDSSHNPLCFSISNLLLAQSFEHKDLSKKGIELYVQKGQISNFEEVLGSDNGIRLVYRISDNVCSVCYDETIKEIVSFANSIGYEKMIILVPVNSIRELKSYLNRINSNVVYYAISKGSSELELDPYSPFFFVLDDKMIAKHVFIPPKNDVEATSKYLDFVRQRFF